MAETFSLDRWVKLARSLRDPSFSELVVDERDWSRYAVETYEQVFEGKADLDHSFSISSQDEHGTWLLTRTVVRHPDTSAWLEQRMRPPRSVGVLWPGDGPISRRERERAEELLFDALPLVRDFGWRTTPGPASERAERIAKYEKAIIQRRDAGYPESKITMLLVRRRLGGTGDPSQLYDDVGPWKPFRARVYRQG